jgi:hypothetical protein
MIAGIAGPANAAGLKVVVIVGPSGGSTSDYISNAKSLASTARSSGADVVELYTPNATWSKVVSASKGANIVIYLGHGNGWPSPYAPFQGNTKNGFGLNAYEGSGNTATTYYGENHVRNLEFAPGAVVILNRLCYASGNSEWGWADPSQSVAKERIDNYATGFLAAGASVVIAEAIQRPTYALTGLFAGTGTMRELFWDAPNASGARDFAFNSTRTPGAQALSDPTQPGKYWRSIVGDLDFPVATWKNGEPDTGGTGKNLVGVKIDRGQVAGTGSGGSGRILGAPSVPATAEAAAEAPAARELAARSTTAAGATADAADATVEAAASAPASAATEPAPASAAADAVTDASTAATAIAPTATRASLAARAVEAAAARATPVPSWRFGIEIR